MAHAVRVDVDKNVRCDPATWARRLVQACAEDVVIAAARFKPNAAGSSELTLGSGFGHRQLLKARGTYLGERIVLGVTPLHVHAVSASFGGRLPRIAASWPRVDLQAELVAARGVDAGDAWPALLLIDRLRGALAELQPMERNDEAWRVLTLVLAHDAVDAR